LNKTSNHELRERLRAEGRRLIAEGRGLIVTRRLLCGLYRISSYRFDTLLLLSSDPSSVPSRAPVFPNHVDLVIALEIFFGRDSGIDSGRVRASPYLRPTGGRPPVPPQDSGVRKCL